MNIGLIILVAIEGYVFISVNRICLVASGVIKIKNMRKLNFFK